MQRAAVFTQRREQRLTGAGMAPFFPDMFLILMPEVFQCGHDWIGGCLPKRTKRRIFDHTAKQFKHGQIGSSTLPPGDAGEDGKRLCQSFTARGAFATRLPGIEFEKVAGHIHHAVVLIHHHHTARPHDRSYAIQRFVVDRRRKIPQRYTASRRASCLYRFHPPGSARSFANSKYELLQPGAKRKLHQPGIFHLADQREDFGAGTFFRPDGFEPCTPFLHDDRHVAPGLHVVDICGFSIQSPACRIRRAWHRTTGFSFNGSDQCRLFTTNKCAGSFHHIQPEVQSGTQDIFTQQTKLSGLSDRFFQPLHGERIFRSHIGDPAVGTHRISTNQHPLNQHMGIALNLVAIHIRAGVTLIGIADKILLTGFLLLHDAPLYTGRETGTSPAAELRFHDFIDHFSRLNS